MKTTGPQKNRHKHPSIEAEAVMDVAATNLRKRDADDDDSVQPPSKRPCLPTWKQQITSYLEAATTDSDELPLPISLDYYIKERRVEIIMDALLKCPQHSPQGFVYEKSYRFGKPSEEDLVLYHGGARLKRKIPPGTFFTSEKGAACRYCFKQYSDNQEAYILRIVAKTGDKVIDFSPIYEQLKGFFSAGGASDIIRGMNRLGVLSKLSKAGIRFLCVCYQSMDEFILTDLEQCVGAVKFLRGVEGSEEIDMSAVAEPTYKEIEIHRENIRKANQAGVYF